MTSPRNPDATSAPALPGSPRRVALLGAGYIAAWHAKTLALVDGVSLVAVCDRAFSRARACADAFGIPHAYPSLEQMLAAEPLDAVHVLLPPDRHFQAAQELLQAGISVFLEKPMCARADECQQLLELAAQQGVRVGVGHNFLFDEPYQKLRRDLAAGVFGPLDALTITWNKELGQLASGPFDAWMLRQPENILIEIGPHLMAHVLDLVGPPGPWQVRASRSMVLPTGARFFRRWRAYAEVGPTAVELRLSFGPGFTEHQVHVRGHLAAATVDFERNTYVVERHAPLEIDFERLVMAHAEAGQSCRQAWSTVANYVLAKAKLSRTGGSPYADSILGATRAFYASPSQEPDRRISAPLAHDVVSLCEQMGRAADLGVVGVGIGKPARSRVAAQPGKQVPELILGASGFIGRELVRQCVAAGRRVRVLVRGAARLPADLRGPGVDVVEGDLENTDDLERALVSVERVCHLARANVKTWAEYQRHEIDMTRRVADACLAAGVRRFVYTSTIDCYFAGQAGERISESTPLDPQIEGRNLYARAKAASEGLLVGLGRERQLPLVIVRPGIVIGRGGSPFHWGVGMWRHNAICQLWGDGRNKLPLVLVDDVASGLRAALDTPGIEGESFNLVGEPCLSAQEYLDALDEAGGFKIQRFPTPLVQYFAADMVKWLVKVMVRFPERWRPTYRDRLSRTQRATFDCSHARTRLAWRPESDREELIRRGIAEPLAEILAPETDSISP